MPASLGLVWRLRLDSSYIAVANSGRAVFYSFPGASQFLFEVFDAAAAKGGAGVHHFPLDLFAACQTGVEIFLAATCSVISCAISIKEAGTRRTYRH